MIYGIEHIFIKEGFIYRILYILAKYSGCPTMGAKRERLRTPKFSSQKLEHLFNNVVLIKHEINLFLYKNHYMQNR